LSRDAFQKFRRPVRTFVAAARLSLHELSKRNQDKTPVHQMNIMGNDEYIQRLQAAIFQFHGCEARHLMSAPVHEAANGQLTWAGTVEVFTVKGHPSAQHCYAWMHKNGRHDREEKLMTVLETPDVSSPISAVRSIIANETQAATT
jgi:hypothetical protein